MEQGVDLRSTRQVECVSAWVPDRWRDQEGLRKKGSGGPSLTEMDGKACIHVYTPRPMSWVVVQFRHRRSNPDRSMVL